MANKPNVGQQLVKSAVDSATGLDSVWKLTGKFLMVHRERLLDLGSDHEGTDKQLQQKMQTAFGVVLTEDAGNDVPMDGYTVGTKKKDPELIQLKDDTGQVKWRSWDRTARMMQNLSTIFPAIITHGVDKIFPMDEMLSKYKIDQLMATDSGGEAPVKTIIRSLDMILKVVDKIEDIAEVGVVESKLNELTQAWNDVALPIKQAVANTTLKMTGTDDK